MQIERSLCPPPSLITLLQEPLLQQHHLHQPLPQQPHLQISYTIQEEVYRVLRPNGEKAYLETQSPGRSADEDTYAAVKDLFLHGGPGYEIPAGRYGKTDGSAPKAEGCWNPNRMDSWME